MLDDAGGTAAGVVCQPPASPAADEVLAVELVDGELEGGELMDPGFADVASSAPPSVPLLDVPLTEAIMAEVKGVVLDHADHNGDDEDDVDVALVNVSVAAIAVSRDVDVIATVLEVQAVSLPYCRG